MERRETESGRDKCKAPEGEDLIVDGFRVPRSVSEKWNLESIRKAIATIDFWYPNKRKLQREVNFTALLHTVLRKQDEEQLRASERPCGAYGSAASASCVAGLTSASQACRYAA